MKCLGRPATVIGTESNDVLKGGPSPDVIVGLGGSDLIRSFTAMTESAEVGVMRTSTVSRDETSSLVGGAVTGSMLT